MEKYFLSGELWCVSEPENTIMFLLKKLEPSTEMLRSWTLEFILLGNQTYVLEIRRQTWCNVLRIFFKFKLKCAGIALHLKS